MASGPLYEPLAQQDKEKRVWEGRKQFVINALYLLGTVAVMGACLWSVSILAIAFKP